MSYPHLWIPRAQILEPRDALALPRTGMAGRFRIRGRKADGRERLIADWQPNLILDAGLEGLAVGAWATYCVVGSGATAPATTDTALVSLVAAAGTSVSVSSVQSSSPYYGYRGVQAVFEPPASSVVLSEIGWGWADDGGSLFSRALIKDEGGTPQSFVWPSDESLTVDYEVRSYPWTTDVVSASTIGGVSTTCTVRAARVATQAYWRVSGAPYTLWANSPGTPTSPVVSDGALQSITAAIAGTQTSASSTIVHDYVAGSRKRTGSATWEGGVANYAGGITAFMGYATNGCWKIGFDPSIAKTSGKILTLNLESPTWGRQP